MRIVAFICAFIVYAVCLPRFVGAQVPVTLGLEVWLDAADASTFTFSGSAITQWADKTGNGHHATPTSGNITFAPTRNIAALGGNPAVRFDGVNDGLVIAGTAGEFTRPYTAFIVDQYYGGIQGRTLQGRDGQNWLAGKWATRDAHFANGFVYQPAAGTNSTAIGEATGNPTSSNYFVNGLSVGTSGAPTGNPSRLGLVGGGQFSGEQSQADVAEVLWYNRVLTPIERQQVGAYLQNKWGIAGVYNDSVLASISQGAFSGGDVGEGLDLDGHFLYAVNVRGPAAGAVRDANFTADSAPGVTVSAVNEILNWHSPNYGATTNDNNLETVMQSIRWTALNQNPGTGVGDVAVSLAGLTPGEDYRLQLLFAESCCSRGFDVFVENLLVADEFSPQVVQGGINNTAMGAQLTVDLFAPDGTLNFNLNGLSANFGDRNPILNGFTLEFFPNAVADLSIADGSTLNFQADLISGPTMDTQTITIENTGEALSELVIVDAILSGDSEFSLVDFVPGTTLAQGETLDIVVKFDGSNAEFFEEFLADLEILTNSGATFGSMDGQSFSFALQAVATPEPGALSIWVLLGLTAVVGWKWRRRNA